MAELLIKAVDAVHPDPVKNQSACYKQGDIVDVKPDGFEWGRLETLPPKEGGKFAVVQIQNVTPEQVVNWVKTHWGVLVSSPDIDVSGTMTRRRRIRIDIDLLPNAVKQQLNQTGFYSTSWDTARRFLRNKLTNETADNQPIE